MPFSLSLKSLIRLQKRQLLAGKTKRDLIGPLIMLVYMWGVEIVVYFVVKEEVADLDIPPMVLLIACAGLLIFDFIYKLIFVRDHTVMDAFLKTRPVLQAQWNRFLALSQCWSVSNLTMPVMVLPVCLLFLPFFRGLALWIGLYVASVLGGCLVMLLKRRGTYAPEKVVSTKAARTVKSERSGHAIFGLQSRSLFRSKRMKTALIYFSIFSFLETIVYYLGGDNRYGSFWLFLFITYPAIALPQYGFGVEAGCFGGLWTRPVAVKRLLLDKCRMSAVLSGMALLIILPFCLWFKQDFFLPVSYALFGAGFGAPILLVDAYNATPFDLFGKTFFNSQGTKGAFKVSSFVGSLIIMGLGLGLPALLPGWPSYLILSALGLLGILFHRPWFDWVERRFLNNKYRYMEKYQSR